LLGIVLKTHRANLTDTAKERVKIKNFYHSEKKKAVVLNCSCYAPSPRAHAADQG
jgi:hypothetical protein